MVVPARHQGGCRPEAAPSKRQAAGCGFPSQLREQCPTSRALRIYKARRRGRARRADMPLELGETDCARMLRQNAVAGGASDPSLCRIVEVERRKRVFGRSYDEYF